MIDSVKEGVLLYSLLRQFVVECDFAIYDFTGMCSAMLSALFPWMDPTFIYFSTLDVPLHVYPLTQLNISLCSYFQLLLLLFFSPFSEINKIGGHLKQ